jgi:5'-3' exonuclease
LTKSFFVTAAREGLEDHWRTLASLALHSRGLSLELTAVPPFALEWVLDEHEQYVQKTQRQDMTDAIFDANSLYARAWYASLGNRRRDGDGKTCAAIEASLGILLSIIGGKISSPDRLLFCWDTQQKKDKRREPKPPEYDEELCRFRNLLSQLFGAAHAVPPAHEGDDAVCTAVTRADPKGDVYVVSGDKDLQQLQGSNVRYYCLNEKAVLSRTFILHRWHVKKPSQIAIALAILGDPGDCVPGYQGVGRKEGPEAVRGRHG